jgi:hypothetical protein
MAQVSENDEPFPPKGSAGILPASHLHSSGKGILWAWRAATQKKRLTEGNRGGIVIAYKTTIEIGNNDAVA